MSHTDTTLPAGHFATIELRTVNDRIVGDTAVHPDVMSNEDSLHRVAHAIAGVAGDLSPSFQKEMDVTGQLADAQLEFLGGHPEKVGGKIVHSRGMTADGIMSGVVITLTGFIGAVLLVIYAYSVSLTTLGWFSTIALAWTTWGLFRAGMALPLVAAWHLMTRRDKPDDDA